MFAVVDKIGLISGQQSGGNQGPSQMGDAWKTGKANGRRTIKVQPALRSRASTANIDLQIQRATSGGEMIQGLSESLKSMNKGLNGVAVMPARSSQPCSCSYGGSVLLGGELNKLIGQLHSIVIREQESTGR